MRRGTVFAADDVVGTHAGEFAKSRCAAERTDSVSGYFIAAINCLERSSHLFRCAKKLMTAGHGKSQWLGDPALET